MRTHFFLLAAVLLAVGAGCDVPNQGARPPAVPNSMPMRTGVAETEMRASSSAYTVLWAGGSKVAVTLVRPDMNDASVVLSVPGTYSSPQNTVEGFVVVDGSIIQDKERQGWNGAALFSKEGTVRILATNRGRLLTKTYLAEVADRGGSLIQGHLLVASGVAEHFVEQPLYVRRALAVFADGRLAIVESRGALDLNNFAADLVTLGVVDAINLDMGSWSAGWYRHQKTGGVVDIGVRTENTSRQTNWIVFRTEASD